MLEPDEHRILNITVRVIEAPVNIHAIDLRLAGSGSSLWALTAGSVQSIGRPGYSLGVPPGAESFPSRMSQLTVKRVEPVLRRLRGLLLPASPPYTGGLDGHSFSVRFERALSYVEYHWWDWAPDAWAPLGDIVDEILSLAGEPDWPRARRGSGSASSP